MSNLNTYHLEAYNLLLDVTWNLSSEVFHVISLLLSVSAVDYIYYHFYSFSHHTTLTHTDHTKLCGSMPDIHIDEIHVAMEKVFKNMRINLEAQGIWPDNLPKRS